jgi:tripartite-type tricarboxylate transporter receptor subunit TctC
VVVENRPGANGLIGAQSVARGEKDGSGVFQCSMGTMAIVPNVPGTQLPIDVDKELVPVAMVSVVTYGLVTSAESPHKSVADVLAAAKARPGKVSYASTGPGSAQHVASEMLGSLAGVQMIHVPYKGGPQALQDVLPGRVDLFITSIADSAAHIKSGKLKLLAIADKMGHPEFPGVPSMGDSVSGYSFQSWMGICGPRGMPQDAINSWAESIRAGVQDPAMQTRLRGIGMLPLFEGPQQLGARLESNKKQFIPVIAAAGIKSE